MNGWVKYFVMVKCSFPYKVVQFATKMNGTQNTYVK